MSAPAASIGAPGAADGSVRPGTVHAWMVAVLLCSTVLSRFGIDVGAYSLDFALIAMAGLSLAMLGSAQVRVDAVALAFYAAGVAGAAISFMLNESAGRPGSTSPTSMLLLAVMYLPFLLAVTMPATHGLAQRTILDAFSRVAVLVAACGIAQFFVQHVYTAPWLFDYTPMLPERLRANGGYNTVIPVGDLFKSNGFFLREPSSFSLLMALGIVVELAVFRRWWRIATFALGLAVSYSGTGLLALAIGLMFPPSVRTLQRVLLAGVAAALAALVLWEPLNLSFTLGRVAEFGDERSSAYIRFIAPVKVVIESLGATPWSALVGQGPGSILRVSRGFESFDPTWAKALFEYGLVGAVAFIGLVVRALAVSGTPPPIAAVLCATWLLMGGHLLTPESLGIMYVLACAWRAPPSPDADASA